MIDKIKKNKNGATAIIMIVIISAAVLIMAKSISFLSLGELEISVLSGSGNKAYYAADGCMEEALRRLKQNSSYTATDESLSLSDNFCIINVTANGDDRTIIVKAQAGDYYHALQTELTITNGNIVINSRQTIAN